MGIEDCLAEIVEAAKGGLTKVQAEDMLKKAVNAFDRGISEQSILNDLDQIAELRKEKIKKTRKLNALRDFSIRKTYVQQIFRNLDEEKPIKVFGKTIYNPIERRFLDLARQHEQWVRQLQDSFKQGLEGRLDDLGLKQFYIDPANQVDIIKEIDHLTVRGEIPKNSKTGNDRAFKVAREIVNLRNDVLTRKQAAGSTIGFLEHRISANMWDPIKLANMSDDDFYNIVRDWKWGDELVEKKQWIELKEKVISGKFADLEEVLNYGQAKNPSLSGVLAGNNTLAEFTGLSRKINPTTDQYIGGADKVFRGQNLAHRVSLELERDARLIGDLEFWGSDPRAQYEKVLEQLQVETRGDKRFKRSDGKHVLDNDFLNRILPDSIFRIQATPDNATLANWGNLIRNASATAKLSASVLTAQMDVATKAVRTVQLRNGKDSVFRNLFTAYGDLIKIVGSETAKKELQGFAAGIKTMHDDLILAYRYFDPEESAVTSKMVNRANQALSQVFKLNGLEWWTRNNVIASYVNTMNIFHSIKSKALNQLDEFSKNVLESNGITELEWDFIRKHAVDNTSHGDGILSTKKLSRLELNTFKELDSEITSNQGLKNLQNKLMSKWNSLLYREAQTMTIVPDVVDNARLLRGTRPGTALGELARTMTQFRTFAMGFAARILVPLFRTGNPVTTTEFIAAATTLGMLKFWLDDLLDGKTPRDFSKPQNMAGVVSLAIGFPFLDDFTFASTAEHPTASTILDIGAGPVLSDAAETAARAVQVGQKIADGEFDADIGKKALARTFLPTPFLRNYPLLGTAYNTLIYNNVMEALDPGYKVELAERLEERGQEFTFGL